MSLQLHRERTFALLVMVDATFVVLHLLSRVAVVDGSPVVKRHEFLDLGAEVSFPTWWQQSQLLLAAALCLLVGVASATSPGRDRRSWTALGGIFVFLSADEGTQFHEGFIDPMRRAFDISGGAFTFAWVIPAAAALVVFGVAYARFWWRLPKQPRWLVAVAGATFVVGALGFEMVGGSYRTGRGADRGYEAIVAAEEALEMVGASVFLLALLTVLRMRQGPAGVGVQVVVEAPAPDVAEPRRPARLPT